MNVQLLIDSVVRQTTVLIAELATSGGLRAPLARVANQVFLELSDELYAQGVSRKVSADMFGMALRTYMRRIQRLRESSTDEGRSLWQAVLDHLSDGRLVTRGEVLQRFHRDDGALHDLVENGLVLKMGKGANTAYRAATREEIASLDRAPDRDGTDELVWAIVFREGPITDASLGSLVRGEALEGALSRLLASGRVQESAASGQTTYSARDFLIEEGAERGWEAAVFDHFQAVVKTIGARLRSEIVPTPGALGGSTYAFDVWPGHPHEAEVLGMLQALRERTGAIKKKVREHNATHARPRRYTEVTFYGGQTSVVPSYGCYLPQDPGSCAANLARFSYDAATGTCRRFVYGGCGGNENRFATQRDCEISCAFDPCLRGQPIAGDGGGGVVVEGRLFSDAHAACACGCRAAGRPPACSDADGTFGLVTCL